MRFIKVEERLPEIINRKSTPKYVRYLKKPWKGDPYISRAVAYYFPDRFKTVEWEDWDDYSEEDFPYTESDADSGVVWLRAGWYVDIDCETCEGHWSSPLNVVEWLDEQSPDAQISDLEKRLRELSNTTNDLMKNE